MVHPQIEIGARHHLAKRVPKPPKFPFKFPKPQKKKAKKAPFKPFAKKPIKKGGKKSKPVFGKGAKKGGPKFAKFGTKSGPNWAILEFLK